MSRNTVSIVVGNRHIQMLPVLQGFLEFPVYRGSLESQPDLVDLGENNAELTRFLHRRWPKVTTPNVVP